MAAPMVMQVFNITGRDGKVFLTANGVEVCEVRARDIRVDQPLESLLEIEIAALGMALKGD